MQLPVETDEATLDELGATLALERLGHRNHALYDGSWAEWGMYDDLPVQTGS